MGAPPLFKPELIALPGTAQVDGSKWACTSGEGRDERGGVAGVAATVLSRPRLTARGPPLHGRCSGTLPHPSYSGVRAGIGSAPRTGMS